MLKSWLNFVDANVTVAYFQATLKFICPLPRRRSTLYDCNPLVLKGSSLYAFVVTPACSHWSSPWRHPSIWVAASLALCLPCCLVVVDVKNCQWHVHLSIHIFCLVLSLGFCIRAVVDIKGWCQWFVHVFITWCWASVDIQICQWLVNGVTLSSLFCRPT